MKKCVKVTISPNGAVEVDAVGYKGKGCAAVTDALTKGLGKVTDSKKKPDYFMPEPRKVAAKEGSGNGND